MGVKLISGHAVWNPIRLGDQVTLAWLTGNQAAGERRYQDNVVQSPAPVLAKTRQHGGPLFDVYLFSDYSGAKSHTVQKKAIQVVRAESKREPERLGGFSRSALTTLVLEQLRTATKSGLRTCAGFDHQFSIPMSLAIEIGQGAATWRELLHSLVSGTYGEGAPALRGPWEFGKQFNDWLASQGHPAYFWSATKGTSYGVPRRSPTGRTKESLYRLTETARPFDGRGNPKPLCRVGDNGSVGGQSLLGIRHLHDLMEACRADQIPLKVWPFDGLDIRGYQGHHVLMEPYPVVSRPLEADKSDLNDALAALSLVRDFDHSGRILDLLDLSSLTENQQSIVRLEGWIVGHLPISLPTLRTREMRR